jgi:hypothetical protein
MSTNIIKPFIIRETAVDTIVPNNIKRCHRQSGNPVPKESKFSKICIIGPISIGLNPKILILVSMLRENLFFRKNLN